MKRTPERAAPQRVGLAAGKKSGPRLGEIEMKRDAERLQALEVRLAGMLRPVAAPRGLVQRLRSRIHVPDRSVIVERLHDWQSLMLVLGGVISGGLVVLTVARAIFHLVGRRNIG